MTSSIKIRAVTDARLLKRGCESLLGLCTGLVADGELNDIEIQFLRTWLLENEAIAKSWPGEVLHLRVCSVLEDGLVTNDERTYLIATLNELVGGSFTCDGAVPSGATTLPIDENVTVTIKAQSFCFTGKFLFGTRAACERAIEKNGGSIKSVNRSLSYLVIGELSSRDWKYSSFGNKIEDALELKRGGHLLHIVSEAQWASALVK